MYGLIQCMVARDIIRSVGQFFLSLSGLKAKNQIFPESSGRQQKKQQRSFSVTTPWLANMTNQTEFCAGGLPARTKPTFFGGFGVHEGTVSEGGWLLELEPELTNSVSVSWKSSLT